MKLSCTGFSSLSLTLILAAQVCILETCVLHKHSYQHNLLKFLFFHHLLHLMFCFSLLVLFSSSFLCHLWLLLHSYYSHSILPHLSCISFIFFFFLYVLYMYHSLSSSVSPKKKTFPKCSSSNKVFAGEAQPF